MPEPITDPSTLRPGTPIRLVTDDGKTIDCVVDRVDGATVTAHQSDPSPAAMSWFQATAAPDLQSHTSTVISRVHEDLGAKLLAADEDAHKLGCRLEVVDWGTTSEPEPDGWAVKAWAKTRCVPLESGGTP